jgi:hypothetical protein
MIGIAPENFPIRPLGNRQIALLMAAQRVLVITIVLRRYNLLGIVSHDVLSLNSYFHGKSSTKGKIIRGGQSRAFTPGSRGDPLGRRIGPFWSAVA